MFYLHTLLDGPDFLCKLKFSTGHPLAGLSLFAKTNITFRGNHGRCYLEYSRTRNLAYPPAVSQTLRPLIQICLYRVGLTENSGQEGEHSGSTLTNMIPLPGARLRLDSIAELGIIRPNCCPKNDVETYSGSALKKNSLSCT